MDAFIEGSYLELTTGLLKDLPGGLPEGLIE